MPISDPILRKEHDRLTKAISRAKKAEKAEEKTGAGRRTKVKANFTGMLRDLVGGIGSIVEIQKLELLAGNLVRDYYQTAKKKIRIKRYVDDETEDFEDCLSKYHLSTRKEIELTKFHEERGKEGCSCYDCQEKQTIRSEIKHQLDQEPKEREEVRSDCGHCCEYKKVSVDSGLCLYKIDNNVNSAMTIIQKKPRILNINPLSVVKFFYERLGEKALEQEAAPVLLSVFDYLEKLKSSSSFRHIPDITDELVIYHLENICQRYQRKFESSDFKLAKVAEYSTYTLKQLQKKDRHFHFIEQKKEKDFVITKIAKYHHKRKSLVRLLPDSRLCQLSLGPEQERVI
ncbi:6440_t:CDS:2, partial [Racocetra fulgida]